MNKLIAVGIALVCLSGCASAGILSEGMQPDGSYRIMAGGNAFANEDDVQQAAYSYASGLCPTGYTTLSDMKGSVGLKGRRQIIVKCKEVTTPSSP